MSSATFVVLALVVAWITQRLYSAFFGSLSRYPGPVANRISGIPFMRTIWTGSEAADLAALHRMYGPVVRVATEQLSFLGSSQTWADICGPGKGTGEIRKDPTFYGHSLNQASNLLLSSVDEHRRQRKIIGQAFSEKALKAQEPRFQRWAEALCQKLNERCIQGLKSEPFDMVKMLNCTTFDTMADLCFSEPLYMLENSEYTPWVAMIFQSLKKTSQLRVVRLIQPFTIWLLRVTLPRIPAIHAKLHQHWKYTADRVDRRIAASLEQPDLWTSVLGQTKDGDNAAEELDLPSQYANAALFMIAGTETSATALSATMYHLLRNPTAMSRLRDEVKGLLSIYGNSRRLRLEDLASKCPWLNACINEGLRMHPPVPIGLPRVTPPEGVLIAGGFVPGNTSVSVHQYATYHSPALWKDPDTFAPQRWLRDEEAAAYKDDHRDAFEPFSFGPRNCIGKSLSWHEMRLLLATLVLHFAFELCLESKDWSDQKVYTLWEKHPLMVRVSPLQAS